MAESVNGLYKTEVIRRRGPWRSLETVEFATLEWSSGSTTAGCSSRSETCLPPKRKYATTPSLRTPPWRVTQENWPPANPARFSLPVAVRHPGPQALSALGAAKRARHVGLGPCLVDKDQARGSLSP